MSGKPLELVDDPGDAGPPAWQDDPAALADVDAYLHPEPTPEELALAGDIYAGLPEPDQSGMPAFPRADAPAQDPTVALDDFVARRDENSAALIGCEQGTVLPPAGLGLYVSKSGAGKTTSTIDFLLHAAAGVQWCGLSFPRPLRILVIENEGPREAFRQKIEHRLASWTRRDNQEPIRIWDDPARWGQVRLSNAQQLEELRWVADEHRIDLCISDTLTRFGMRGNGTPEETRDFVELLTSAGLTRTLAFLLLHHPVSRPDQVNDELERIAGAWPPHADAIFYLQKLPGLRARLSFPKLRWAHGQRSASILAFNSDTEAYEFVADENSEDDDRDYLAELTEALADGAWKTVHALRQPAGKGGIGAREEAIKNALADPRFEAAKGEDIGQRRGGYYYRLRNPHDNPHENPHHGPVGVVGQQRLRVTSDEVPPPSHAHVSGGTGGWDIGDTPDDTEIERLAALAEEAPS